MVIYFPPAYVGRPYSRWPPPFILDGSVHFSVACYVALLPHHVSYGFLDPVAANPVGQLVIGGERILKVKPLPIILRGELVVWANDPIRASRTFVEPAFTRSMNTCPLDNLWSSTANSSPQPCASVWDAIMWSNYPLTTSSLPKTLSTAALWARNWNFASKIEAYW